MTSYFVYIERAIFTIVPQSFVKTSPVSSTIKTPSIRFPGVAVKRNSLAFDLYTAFDILTTRMDTISKIGK